jgi:hypothetical protein
MCFHFQTFTKGMGLGQFIDINQMITLSVITLSGLQSIEQIIFYNKLYFIKKLYFITNYIL